MDSGWIAVIGTLGGVALTGFSGYQLQRLQGRKEELRQQREHSRELRTRWDTTRLQTYGAFLVACEEAHDALAQIIYHGTVSRDRWIEPRWEAANPRLAKMRSQCESVALLATDPVTNAARDLQEQLELMEKDLHEWTRTFNGPYAPDPAPPPPKSHDEYTALYQLRRDELISAAQDELVITQEPLGS